MDVTKERDAAEPRMETEAGGARFETEIRARDNIGFGRSSTRPINYTDSWTRAWNTFAPFFKVNPGMEPWRQQLLASGWDNLQTVRRNRHSGQKLKPEDRKFINNWMINSAFIFFYIK